jgi:hypothetical protein
MIEALVAIVVVVGLAAALVIADASHRGWSLRLWRRRRDYVSRKGLRHLDQPYGRRTRIAEKRIEARGETDAR